MKFEKAVDELSRVVKELEKDDVELERAVELYEKGMQLAKVADDILAKAELRVDQLNKSI